MKIKDSEIVPIVVMGINENKEVYIRNLSNGELESSFLLDDVIALDILGHLKTQYINTL